jgi:sugar phosphate isomerase/epimerase
MANKAVNDLLALGLRSTPQWLSVNLVTRIPLNPREFAMRTASDSSLIARRNFLLAASAATAGFACSGPLIAKAAESTDASAPDAKPSEKRQPTIFQHACMTLPYSNFPLERALSGIKSAGYEYVAWGTSHKEADGKSKPVLASDASAAKAKELATRCRDLGLQPVMMFSGVYPENDGAVEILKQRVLQAEAAGIGQVLTFGHTEGGKSDLWIERFKTLGPFARDHGVMIVVKQHGGSTGTGEALAKIVREVDDPGIMVNYDAGNVMDYLDVDPIPDILKCSTEIRSFCMKDHRNWPRDQDCGPGFGEIDHYRLLEPVAFTGLTMPLAYENIFPPLVERPNSPEAIDMYARRSKEYVETVIAGLQNVAAKENS